MDSISLQEIQIRRALYGMGILPTRKGYRYLLDAVRAACEGEIPGRQVYQQLGEAYGIKASSIKSSIQYVIGQAHNRCTPLYLEITGSGRAAPAPTPSEFICLLAAWLEDHRAP